MYFENGYFYIKNNQATLIWAEHGYLFELMGYPAITIEEMKELAVSIKQEKKE
ncbi:DUF4367 domain-containing protein [Robinsoniella peoriensis]|uniref:DUF4367 domain-containing protein n=1 Tax=Robinsoniella peoriensis TaxID=180332 RepID=UPI003A7F2CDA